MVKNAKMNQLINRACKSQMEINSLSGVKNGIFSRFNPFSTLSPFLVNFGCFWPETVKNAKIEKKVLVEFTFIEKYLHTKFQ